MNCMIPTKQRGAALVVALLFLTVLTLLGLSASQSTRLQEHMAGNFRDMDVAFQAAEAGVRNAEDAIVLLAPGDQPLCSTAPCAVYNPGGTFPADMGSADNTWWSNNGTQFGDSSTKEMAMATADPYYVIETTAFVPDTLDDPRVGRTFFRTVSGATGATATARVVIETVYTRRL